MTMENLLNILFPATTRTLDFILQNLNFLQLFPSLARTILLIIMIVLVGAIPLIIAFIVDLVTGPFRALKRAFNRIEDDNAREFIASTPPDRLYDLIVNDISSAILLLENLLKGNTGNADENAIIRLLSIASNRNDCARVLEMIRGVGDGDLDDGRKRLKRNLQGPQDDQLDQIFEDCGLG